MALIGYARVSTPDQTLDAQLDALRAAGCVRIYEEKASGAFRARPVLARVLYELDRGDVLVVTKLDRLARSTKHLIDVVEDLEVRGIGFRALGNHIDTTTPQGKFTLVILGAVGELERELIRERTRAGMAAAKRRGSQMGNPGLRPDAQPKVRNAARRTLSIRRDAHYLQNILNGVDDWLPLVRRLRPDVPWVQTARAVNAALPEKRRMTPERLTRAVKRLVREGLADARLLQRAPNPHDTRLVRLVAGLISANPGFTYAELAQHLEKKMLEPTPQGRRTWSVSTVAHLVNRAGAMGMLPSEMSAKDPRPRRGRPRSVARSLST